MSNQYTVLPVQRGYKTHTGQSVRKTPLQMMSDLNGRLISNSGNKKMNSLDKFILIQGGYPFNAHSPERQSARKLMKGLLIQQIQ